MLILSAADQAKTLSSLTFTHTSGGTLAVMGVSGETIAVPEPSASAMLLLAGLTGLRRRRR